MSDFPEAQPHEALVEAFPDVFTQYGSVRMGPGLRIPRNMVVLRHDGALTLISAARLDEAGLKDLEALGTVAHRVKLGFSHGMDDGFYVDRCGADGDLCRGGAKAGLAQTIERVFG